jgi:hypothetical protein
MRLWAGPSDSGCCSLDDFLDARLVAERLGFPFYVMEFSEVFGRAVVDAFVDEYRRGRTPNPCARCNQYVKFAGFWDRARELGATRIATGHYARVTDDGGRVSLLAGVDADKDQSYFLFGIEPAVLARTLFPVGGLRKSVVRAEAARRGLSVAGKPDSQEVCFVPRGRYAAFVERHASSVPVLQRIDRRCGRAGGGDARRRAPLHDRPAPRARRRRRHAALRGGDRDRRHRAARQRRAGGGGRFGRGWGELARTPAGTGRARIGEDPLALRGAGSAGRTRRRQRIRGGGR